MSCADYGYVFIRHIVMRHDRVVYYEDGIIVELALGNDDRYSLVADGAQTVRKALCLDNALYAVLDGEAFERLFHILLSFRYFRFTGIVEP